MRQLSVNFKSNKNTKSLITNIVHIWEINNDKNEIQPKCHNRWMYAHTHTPLHTARRFIARNLLNSVMNAGITAMDYLINYCWYRLQNCVTQSRNIYLRFVFLLIFRLVLVTCYQVLRNILHALKIVLWLSLETSTPLHRLTCESITRYYIDSFQRIQLYQLPV